MGKSMGLETLPFKSWKKIRSQASRSGHPPQKLRLGCMNVCGCNQDTKGEMGGMCGGSNLDVLALSETELRGNG